MRRATLWLVIGLLTLPGALAERSATHEYRAGTGAPLDAALPAPLATRDLRLWPLAHETALRLDPQDRNGAAVPTRTCHEWTFNDGRHARNVCDAVQCGAHDIALQQPNDPEAVYRVSVRVLADAGPCAAGATVGTLHARLT